MIHRRTAPVRWQSARLFVATILATASVAAVSGCGYRIVRRDDMRVQKLTADSTAMVTLQHEIVALQMKCHADSVRAATDRAALEKSITDHPTLPPPTDSTVKARDAEIATLKDQLTKANAELDRIKRRLANPRS
jgi:septal ring factor EnvC (AmiA/AmiB activator)